MINLGLAFDIAAPVVLIILIIVGATKAWPYRKKDREKFYAIYRPYKVWGFGLFLLLNAIGIVLIFNG